MKELTVLIPTYNRQTALASLLTSLLGQDYKHFDIVISDQSSGEPSYATETALTTVRILETQGVNVTLLRNVPRRGLAQQRQFLLNHVETSYCLYLDDDLILLPFVLRLLLTSLKEEGVGFVGSAVIGLSYVEDIRPSEQFVEFWQGKVQPETVTPGSDKWQRYKLHNAANVYHVQTDLRITPAAARKYKVAWIGGCTLYDTAKLRAAGGFGFWQDLPENHAGEDVLAQLRVMQAYGGFGLMPSGVYHQELQTTVPDRRVNAPDVLFSSSQ